MRCNGKYFGDNASTVHNLNRNNDLFKKLSSGLCIDVILKELECLYCYINRTNIDIPYLAFVRMVFWLGFCDVLVW